MSELPNRELGETLFSIVVLGATHRQSPIDGGSLCRNFLLEVASGGRLDRHSGLD